MFKILIPEDIPSQNKGESALFYGLKESLRLFGDIRLTLFSLYPEVDRKNYAGDAVIIDVNGIAPSHMLHSQGHPLLKIFNYIKFMAKHAIFGLMYKLIGRKMSLLPLSPVWKAYMDADLILMSHDSMYTPLYHGTQALLFKLMRKPAMYFAATIKSQRKGNGVKTRLLNTWVAYTSKKVGAITLREDLSKAYLDKIGVTDCNLPISTFPDLAFLVPPITKEKAKELLKNENVPENQVLIGMAISQRKLDFAFPGQVMNDRRASALASIVTAVNFMTIDLDATVVFIPHSIGPHTILDDRIPAQMIKKQVERPERVINIGTEYTSQELKGMAACLDMTVSTRLHFTIDAVSSAVPSLLITHADDDRCHGIIGSMLGMQEYIYTIDTLDAQTLIQNIDLLWQNRAAVNARLTDLMEHIRKDTYRHGEAAMALFQRSRSFIK